MPNTLYLNYRSMPELKDKTNDVEFIFTIVSKSNL